MSALERGFEDGYTGQPRMLPTKPLRGSSLKRDRSAYNRGYDRGAEAAATRAAIFRSSA